MFFISYKIWCQQKSFEVNLTICFTIFKSFMLINLFLSKKSFWSSDAKKGHEAKHKLHIERLHIGYNRCIISC